MHFGATVPKELLCLEVCQFLGVSFSALLESVDLMQARIAARRRAEIDINRLNGFEAAE